MITYVKRYMKIRHHRKKQFRCGWTEGWEVEIKICFFLFEGI